MFSKLWNKLLWYVNELKHPIEKFIILIPPESGDDGCTEGAVRLVNSTIEHEGRVEVCADGMWGTVCGVYIRDAFAICNTLGYGGGKGIKSPIYCLNA